MYLINIFGSHIYNYMYLYVKVTILEIIFSRVNIRTLKEKINVLILEIIAENMFSLKPYYFVKLI